MYIVLLLSQWKSQQHINTLCTIYVNWLQQCHGAVSCQMATIWMDIHTLSVHVLPGKFMTLGFLGLCFTWANPVAHHQSLAKSKSSCSMICWNWFQTMRFRHLIMLWCLHSSLAFWPLSWINITPHQTYSSVCLPHKRKSQTTILGTFQVHSNYIRGKYFPPNHFLQIYHIL